ncbi:MAG: NAD(P)/FAD-dependent oxidoreductase [Gammaproteobacteria bacterium]|nr:NAD(P)/FAD-dependent oxidoreductase [Gammaproteobacteria bacterium]
MSQANGRALRIVVIGAGMAGILAAIKLREAGYDNFVIYEKAARLGGTWRENTYPGIACDVPAHLYTYTFEPNPHWSHVFAPGEEIQAYFEGVAKKYKVLPSIEFNTEITRCVFENGRWQLTTATGKSDSADVVIAATGVLHYPNTPDIAGLEDFKGACFHSARWNHDVALDGKRVGVIGTGSTAIQITSALVPKVAKFELFQRTAQWVMPIENPAYSSEERAAFAADPTRIFAIRDEAKRMMTDFIANAVINADSKEMASIERACLENLENNVKDPVLREKLRPNYRAACKRLIFSPDFYDAIQRPNAELVTEGITRVEAGGVRTADGRLHELDALVLATGFRADRFIRPTLVAGRGGVTLDDVWADRPIAYLSLSVPGFPNMFLLNGPNGPVGNFSLIQIAEMQLGYVIQLLNKLRDGACREISASASATSAFDQARIEAAKGAIWSTGCKSWYLDKFGVPASWPWSYARFAEEMAAPKFEAFEQVA